MLHRTLGCHDVGDRDGAETLRAHELKHLLFCPTNAQHGCVSLCCRQPSLKEVAEPDQMDTDRLNRLTGIASGVLDRVRVDREAMDGDESRVLVLTRQYLTKGVPTPGRRLHVRMHRACESRKESTAAAAGNEGHIAGAT